MGTPMPTLLVGHDEAAAAASIKSATHFEIVHFVLAAVATEEVPILLSGGELNESTRSSKIGTNDYSKKIRLLLFAPSLAVEQISEIEAVVKAKGLDDDLIISKYDPSRALPATEDPEYVKEVVDRGQSAFRAWVNGGATEKVIVC